MMDGCHGWLVHPCFRHCWASQQWHLTCCLPVDCPPPNEFSRRIVARTKSNPATWPAPLRKLAALLFDRGRWLTVSVALLALFLLAWYGVWREVRAHVLAGPDYVVTPAAVEITPPPPWVHSDIRAEVFGAASLDGARSLLDENLNERIAAAFAMHPWVARVRCVSKQHPALVRVELDYRQPALMVETPAGPLPVDANAVLLPGHDFSPVEKARYPRLVGIETAPLGTLGERWGDGRVYGAAQIAAAIGPAWHEWKLDRILPSAQPASPTPDDYIYALFTRSGTQITWGRAPHINAAGELPVSEKLSRLRSYVAAHGTLEGRAGPQQLDLRSLRAG